MICILQSLAAALVIAAAVPASADLTVVSKLSADGKTETATGLTAETPIEYNATEPAIHVEQERQTEFAAILPGLTPSGRPRLRYRAAATLRASASCSSRMARGR